MTSTDKSAAAPDAELLQAAKAVAFSNGFDAAYPAKLEALRAIVSRFPILPPADPGAVAKWIDDPHDIEQGQMLNPEWLKLHGLTAAEALAAPSVPSASLTTPSKEPAGAVADTDTTTREQYRRMFNAACEALGSINEALKLDPDDGGAEPILEAIQELQGQNAALTSAVRETLARAEDGDSPTYLQSHEVAALKEALAEPDAAIDAREQEAKIAPVPYDKHEAEILAVIDERDRYHDMADQLAAQIAAITGDEIGEHSSDNDPWHNAMLSADEWIARDLRAMFYGESEPYLKKFREKLASRPEAPPASAPAAEVAQPVADEVKRLREALQFYADGNHFTQHQPDAWDTVSGEPSNFYEDESNTATVEDGTVAKMALASSPSSAPAESGLTRDALIELIEENLYGVYHCSRVWEAWNVGTMSRDDFSEARGSDLAPDLADAILALAAAPQAVQAGGEGGA